MANTKVPGYPTVIGDKAVTCVDHTGPASYTTHGESFGAPNQFGGVNQFGLRNYDWIGGGVSQSGTYAVEGRLTGSGNQVTFKLVWSVVATGAEVANATNLSGETVRLLLVGK